MSFGIIILQTYPSPKKHFAVSRLLVLLYYKKGKEGTLAFRFRRSQQMWCAFDAVSFPFSETFFQALKFSPFKHFEISIREYRQRVVERFLGPVYMEVGIPGRWGSPRRVTHLSCKRDQIKMRDYMDRRVIPPKRVTSPTWGPPPPYKQALSYYFTLRYVTLWIQLRLPLRQTDNITLHYAPTHALHSIPLRHVTLRYATLRFSIHSRLLWFCNILQRMYVTYTCKVVFTKKSAFYSILIFFLLCFIGWLVHFKSLRDACEIWWELFIEIDH